MVRGSSPLYTEDSILFFELYVQNTRKFIEDFYILYFKSSTILQYVNYSIYYDERKQKQTKKYRQRI